MGGLESQSPEVAQQCFAKKIAELLRRADEEADTNAVIEVHKLCSQQLEDYKHTDDHTRISKDIITFNGEPSLVARNSKELVQHINFEMYLKEGTLEASDVAYIPVYPIPEDNPEGFTKDTYEGGLYASVSMTGDNSWHELVKMLHAKAPHREFVVYTGRHGDLPNQYDPETHETIGAFDKAEGTGFQHYQEDRKKAKEIMENNSKFEDQGCRWPKYSRI